MSASVLLVQHITWLDRYRHNLDCWSRKKQRRCIGRCSSALGSHGPRQTWLIWSTWRRRWMPSQEGPTLCPIDHHLLVQLYVDLEIQQPVLHLVDIASLWGTSQTSSDLAHLINVEVEVNAKKVHLYDALMLIFKPTLCPLIVKLLVIWSTWRRRWMPRRSTSMTP